MYAHLYFGKCTLALIVGNMMHLSSVEGSRATEDTCIMLPIIPVDLAVTGPRTSRLSFHLITIRRSRYLSFPFSGVLAH